MPNIPKGGGDLITGLTDRKPEAEMRNLNPVTQTRRQVQVWRGVDTNFCASCSWRPPDLRRDQYGSQYTDNCEILVNIPRTALRTATSFGRSRPTCTPMQATQFRSSTCSRVSCSSIVAGIERSADYTFLLDRVEWHENNIYREDNNTGCSQNSTVRLFRHRERNAANR